jgi:hypothetical protein
MPQLAPMRHTFDEASVDTPKPSRTRERLRGCRRVD